MAGLGSLIPKLSAGSGSGFNPRDLPMQDKLLMLSAILKGDNESAMKIPLLAEARQQMAKQSAATQDLAQFASGKAVPQRADIMAAIDPQNATAPAPQGGAQLPGTMGLAPRLSAPDVKIPTRSPTADAMGGPVSVRSALPMLAKLAASGGDPSKWTTMLEAAQPKIGFDRGFGYDERDGTQAGRFHPDMDKGQEPLFDANGRVVAIRNMDGSVRAAAEMEAAKSNAQERAKAGYDLVQVPLSNGQKASVPRLSAVEGGRGAPGLGTQTAGGAIFGLEQSPAEQAGATEEAKARAGARVTLPNDTASLDNAIETATKLRDDPVLEKRTGAWAMIPALPNSHGVAVDALKKQLLGQVFLDAYANLKGGGQITEVEGQKATQAKARLESAQTYKDFKGALDDYIGALSRGKQLLATKAQAAAPSPGAAEIQAEMRRRKLIP